MGDITVIGGGVSGLSCARSLQLAGYDVRIVTRDLPQHTASMAAGAVWSGSGLDRRSRPWAAATLEHFQRQIEIAGSGVTLQRMREVYGQKVPDPWYRERLPFFQRLSKHEMRPGLIDGYLMDVPMVAPPIYLEYLRQQFQSAGGRIERRKVESLVELADEAGGLLVNCTGVGARDLAKDERVYPIRGQTLLLAAQGIRVGYMDNEAVDHIFPRADGVLVGGVKDAGNWNQALDPALSADIIERCARIDRRLADAEVLRGFVGLRPGRDQVRLEAEALANGGTVIHNYGHGAVGYTLSWGCAQAVTALAQSVLT